MAGLGAGLRNDGDMSDESERKALTALCRYKLLLRHMGVKEAQVVATAAVRDAENADDFVDAVTRIGLPCEVISAEEEARYPALGVISAFPGAAAWSATSAAAAWSWSRWKTAQSGATSRFHSAC